MNWIKIIKRTSRNSAFIIGMLILISEILVPGMIGFKIWLIYTLITAPIAIFLIGSAVYVEVKKAKG